MARSTWDHPLRSPRPCPTNPPSAPPVTGQPLVHFFPHIGKGEASSGVSGQPALIMTMPAHRLLATPSRSSLESPMKQLRSWTLVAALALTAVLLPTHTVTAKAAQPSCHAGSVCFWSGEGFSGSYWEWTASSGYRYIPYPLRDHVGSFVSSTRACFINWNPVEKRETSSTGTGAPATSATSAAGSTGWARRAADGANHCPGCADPV
ncbi:peptidase inhibitor family I36 protein [Streptomyces sp. NPDC051310]|uniref:peptidase inhibitor family I36 protein n=1 Tax=Streptomyces sp. NPDC051310 TaxID=3365649 RepID=UPI00379021B1